MREAKLLDRVLVTNDDGIHAPGLKVLEHAAGELAHEVWTVAPEVNHSGAGHSLTIKRPLRCHEVSERRYAVDGTPTDCVLLALQWLLPGPVDLVLSGVNRGGNLGEDVTYSGTVAAAMEATLLDVPAIAFSQCFRAGHPVKWAAAERHTPTVVRKLRAAGWPKGVLINVTSPTAWPTRSKGSESCARAAPSSAITSSSGSTPAASPMSGSAASSTTRVPTTVPTVGRSGAASSPSPRSISI